MYGLGITSCRLARKLHSTQFRAITKFSYGELTNGCIRICTTTVIHNSFDFDARPRRHFSVSNPARDDISKQLNLHLQNVISQSKVILKNVKLEDLNAAPQPAFWYGMSGLIPFALPTVTNIIFGFSPFLTTAQLLYGATICSFLGGIKWGQTVGEKPEQAPTWENLGYAVMPQLIAWIGLLLPQTLGFLAVSGGLASAAYIDLTTGKYPPWFKALRLCLTLPAVLFLLISCLQGLFH